LYHLKLYCVTFHCVRSSDFKQQWKGRYRLADTVMELTFVFLRVTFRRSPGFRSSLVLTNVIDSVDSVRPIHRSTFDPSPPSPTPSPSPPSSFTDPHRCIGSHNPNLPLIIKSKILKFSVFHGKPFQSPKKLRDGPVNGSRTRFLSKFWSKFLTSRRME
jgi:hypothetical protein